MITDDDRRAAKRIWEHNLLRGDPVPDWLTTAVAAHRELGARQEREAVVARLRRTLYDIVQAQEKFKDNPDAEYYIEAADDDIEAGAHREG